MNATAQKIEGTPAELANRLSLNGHILTQADIGFLTRLGLGKKVGTEKSGSGRGGKPATKWAINPRATLKFDMVEEAAQQPSAMVQQPKQARGRNAASNDDQKQSGGIAGITSKSDLAELIVSAVAAVMDHRDKQQGAISADNSGASDTAQA
jgi:hypothetical protein